jgi:hypothetical protein
VSVIAEIASAGDPVQALPFEVNMNKRLLVLAIVLAAIAILAVWSVGAARGPQGTGHKVRGLALITRPASASWSSSNAYDDLMNSEFGCGKGGHLENEVDPG